MDTFCFPQNAEKREKTIPVVALCRLKDFVKWGLMVRMGDRVDKGLGLKHMKGLGIENSPTFG